MRFARGHDFPEKLAPRIDSANQNCIQLFRIGKIAGPAGIRRCSLTIYSNCVMKCGEGARGEGRVFSGSVFRVGKLKMVPRPSDEGSISQLTLAARRSPGGRRLPMDRLMNQGCDSWVKSLLNKDLRFRDESERADSGGESETCVKSDFLKVCIFNGLGRYKST